MTNLADLGISVIYFIVQTGDIECMSMMIKRFCQASEGNTWFLQVGERNMFVTGQSSPDE